MLLDSCKSDKNTFFLRESPLYVLSANPQTKFENYISYRKFVFYHAHLQCVYEDGLVMKGFYDIMYSYVLFPHELGYYAFSDLLFLLLCTYILSIEIY